MVCNVYTLHRFFSDEPRQEAVRAGCTTAAIGCIDCKKMLLEGVSRDLAAIRTRAQLLRQDPARVEQVLADFRERPELARERGRRASEFVRSEYSPEAEEEELLATWNAILAR